MKMKKIQIEKITITILVTLLYITSFSQESCVSCIENEVDGSFPSAIGYQTKALGNYTFASGKESEAIGMAAMALGYYSKALDIRAMAIGYHSEALHTASYSFGNYVRANAPFCFSLGTGYGFSEGEYMVNDNSNSLMIGFNSNGTTTFVWLGEHLIFL